MDQDFRQSSPVKLGDATATPALAWQAAPGIDRSMGYWLDEPRDQHEFVKVRTLWVTITLSFLVHTAALLLVLERTHLLTPGDEASEAVNDRLQVRLAPAPKPLPPAAPEPAREIVALPKPSRPPRPPAPKELPPPVIASTAPGRPIPAPAPPTPAAPAPPVPANSDLWSYLQARRRERGESDAPASDNQRADPNANIAANLPTAATGVATRDPQRGGGIFEIKRMDYDDAAFLFYGWNNAMGRKTPQLIEVRKGNNSDMHIAVVRKMIAIIREYSKEDFVWHSPRHDVTLSARLQDNAALEDFLMRDFFDEAAPRPLRP